MKSWDEKVYGRREGEGERERRNRKGGREGGREGPRTPKWTFSPVLGLRVKATPVPESCPMLPKTMLWGEGGREGGGEGGDENQDK
jgi:hypothetical protein